MEAKQEMTLMEHQGSLSSVAFSPDGKYLATKSRDSTTRVWDVASEQEVARMTYQWSASSVSFSPDGKYLATGSRDNTARVWDVASKQEVARMTHEGSVSSVSFSPDGKYLATGSRDNTARVWDVASGQGVALMTHEDEVSSVIFSPDGKYLATGSSDNTARAWLWRPEDLIAESCSRLTRNLTYEEWRRYLGDEPYRKTCGNLPIHPTFIEAGRDLARAGDVEDAVAIFRRALELEPTLALDPETEVRKFRVIGLIEKGRNLVRQGEVKEAIAAYSEAQKLDPVLEVSAGSWSILGWSGSLWEYASDVMYACEKAVELDPENGAYRDTRGLARALTGDYEGAIEDFRFYVRWAQNRRPKKRIRKRQEWIRELATGRNPLDAATLEALRKE